MQTTDEVRAENLRLANHRRKEWAEISRALKSGTMTLEEALDAPAAQRKRALEVLGLAVVGESLRHGKRPHSCGQRALSVARQMHLGHFAYVHALSDARRVEMCARVAGLHAEAPTAAVTAPLSAAS